MRNKLFSLILLCALSANQNTTVNGNVDYYFMSRLSNSKVVNIPFRVLNLNVYHQRDNVDVKGTLGVEYKPRVDTDFTFNDNPTDFTLVLRDLYITYYLNKGEVSFGKKIYAYGSADDNSPIDNINPYDYYYLLNGTQERKLGIYSSSFNFYFSNNWNIGGIFSPMHNTSRFPINDAEYPIGLSVSPLEGQFLSTLDNPYELSLFMQKSMNKVDLTLSHFSGYDRVFNVSGIGLYQNFFLGWPSGDPLVDIKYSYRFTEANNIGLVVLFDNITIRSDISFMKSYDKSSYDDFQQSDYYQDIILNTDEYALVDASNPSGCVDIDDNPIDCLFPFSENAEYQQMVLQLELPLENNSQLNFQYFNYKINKYDNLLFYYNENELLPDPSEVDYPNLPIDLSSLSEPEDIFIAGFGAPYGLLSKSLSFISYEKLFLDSDLKLLFSTLYDLDDGNGHIYSFEMEYDFGNGLNSLIGFNKIHGDESQNALYPFNSMEDFSSFRTQITYNF